LKEETKNTPPPNYYCTWRLMEWLPENCGEEGLAVRDIMCDKFLFGDDGIAVKMHPGIRGRLFFLLDDGWDLKNSMKGKRDEEEWLKPYLGCCQISDEKFPGYGESPMERLKTMSDKVKALGWRGLGIWISPAIAYGKEVIGREADFITFWKTRLEWSSYAGVAYWKVDWGSFDISDKHKKLLMKEKNRIYPELIIENAFVRAPINRKGVESPFSLAVHRHRLSYSDVLRIYDTTFPLSVPTTLSRVAELLRYPPEMKEGALGYINAEDEVYICAALGFTMGIMRYDIGEKEASCPPNTSYGGSGFFVSTRPARKQLDEVCRAVSWQEQAPAFGIMHGNSFISKEINSDRWKFTRDQTWSDEYCKKEYIEQSAPRIVARNVTPPEIKSDHKAEEYPYVAASRNPNGALSIATFGRVTVDRGYYACEADFYWDAGDLSGEIGVFGAYRSLEIKFKQDLTGKKVFAGDLKDGMLREITDEAVISKNTLKLSKELIQKYSLAAKSGNDFSEDGLVLKIGGTEDYIIPPTPKAKSVKPPRYNLVKASLAITAKVHLANNNRDRKKNLAKFK